MYYFLIVSHLCGFFLQLVCKLGEASHSHVFFSTGTILKGGYICTSSCGRNKNLLSERKSVFERAGSTNRTWHMGKNTEASIAGVRGGVTGDKALL